MTHLAANEPTALRPTHNQAMNRTFPAPARCLVTHAERLDALVLALGEAKVVRLLVDAAQAGRVALSDAERVLVVGRKRARA